MPDYVLEHTPPGHGEGENPAETVRAVISTDEPLGEDELLKAQELHADGKTVEQIEGSLNLGIRPAEVRQPDDVEFVTVPRVEYEALLALQTREKDPI